MKAICTLLLLVAGEVSALELRLQATKPSFRPSDPVVVRVLVSNPHDSTKVWYLKRGFWLTPFSYPMDGDLGLAFEVRGPDGGLLAPTSSRIMVARMLTEPSMFRPLHRGEIFGVELALDGRGLEYKMRLPGRYRVGAVLSPASPRAWFGDWRRGHPSEADPGFSMDDLFEGSLAAEPIEVVIAP